MTLPGWVRAFLRLALPREFVGDVLDDLEDGLARAGGRRAARRRLAGELLRTPYVGLWKQARRMRAAGTRRERLARERGFGMGWMTGTGGAGAELRVATRSLARRPIYGAVAILTLVASIGSATLIFSVLEGVLLRALPFEGGERVYRIFATNEAWRDADQEVLRNAWDRLDLTEDMVEALRGAIPGAEVLGAYHNATVRLEDGLAPVRLNGAYILPGFFETLPMRPVLGRLPGEDETASGASVTVIGEGLWSSRYGRDPDVLGRSVTLGGRQATIVGVLPGNFGVPSELARWWAPLPPDFADGRTDAAVFAGLVRLDESADAAAAAEGVTRVGSALAEGNPTYASMGVNLQPFSELLVADVREGIRLLFFAVVAVVLIASVNLANLVVARGARRRSELAMRTALGASRASLVGTMLSETLVLCGVGGGLGVLAATQLLDPFLALLTWASPDFPRLDDVGLNGAVLLFATGVTVLTAVLSGLLPALAASQRSPWEALQQGRRSRGGRATRRTQRTLLAVEATLAMVLLTGAGLLTRSALHVASIDPGYDPEVVAYVGVQTSDGRYETPAEANALGEALEARLRRLPGTVSVARASALPGLGGADGKLFWPLGGSMETATVTWSTAVSPGYFEALGIPVVAGRAVTAADGPQDTPAVVVSELFARRFFGEEDPVGRTVMMGTGVRLEGGRVVADGQKETIVVGVVADVRQFAVIMEPEPGVYLPIAQTGGADPELILRTAGPPEEVLEAARAEILAEDPALLITETDVLLRSMRRLMGALEVRMILVVALAGLAAFLTVVGIYGVVAYVVSDQVHEIGLRMALGARTGGESSRIVRHALAPVVAGGVLGLGGAWAASGLLEDALFGVEALDLPTYAVVLTLLVAAATLAAWLPARRAASVDPMRVLTEE
ncbi:MAG TPA: ADOP family duplicated permease [Longimicrobiales bacterium]